MAQHEQAVIWGNFWQILEISKRLVQDYEKLVATPEITKQIPQSDTAFIDAIIVHISKLFSSSNNEAFRIGQFKVICRDEIKQELEKVVEEHKDTIGKILTNRDKLVAHLDKRFYELCYSDLEVERMQQQMAKGLRMTLEEARQIYAHMPRASRKKDERYSIADFRSDLPEIKQMLDQLDDIWNRSIPFTNDGAD